MRRHEQIDIAKANFTNLHVDLKFSSSLPAGKPSNEVKTANRSKKIFGKVWFIITLFPIGKNGR